MRFRLGTAQWWLLAVIVGVAVAHAWLAWSFVAMMEDMRLNNTSAIQRMKATYVSELKLSTPPLAAPAPQPARKQPQAAKPARQPAAPAEKASAPPPAASAPEAAAEAPPSASQAQVPDTVVAAAEAASSAMPEASDPALAPLLPPTPPAAAASTSGMALAPRFKWPLATRVSYKVKGYFRGDVHGSAKVEWVRQGRDYQVSVDTIVGPSFAPIFSSQLISAGTITPDGLSPRRFEQSRRTLLSSPKTQSVVFEDEQVVLHSGERAVRTVGMQDASSQFIQLAYRFLMDPALLRTGNVIQMPLAFPKRVETIAYEVLAEELLQTPIGDVPTFHVKPRRMSVDGGVLPVEIWFAPGLQYLPVRILIRADDKTYMDLQMERAPEQTPAESASAEEPAPPASN